MLGAYNRPGAASGNVSPIADIGTGQSRAGANFAAEAELPCLGPRLVVIVFHNNQLRRRASYGVNNNLLNVGGDYQWRIW